MKPIVVTEFIAAPPDRVFATCTDVAAWPDLISAIHAVDLLTQGPVTVGTRFRETRTMLGKQASEEMTVTTYDPPSAWTLEAESHGSRYFTSTTFAPSDSGTRLEMTFSATPRTVAARLVSTLLAWTMARHLRACLIQDVADLKAACEAHAEA